MRFKSCPRCNGDLFLDWDYHGVFLECLQCGYVCDWKSRPNGGGQMAQKGLALAAYRSGELQQGSVTEV